MVVTVWSSVVPSVDANTKRRSDGTSVASVASERNARRSAVVATVAVSSMQSMSTPSVTGTGACPVRKTVHPDESRRASTSIVAGPGMP